MYPLCGFKVIGRFIKSSAFLLCFGVAYTTCPEALLHKKRFLEWR